MTPANAFFAQLTGRRPGRATPRIRRPFFKDFWSFDHRKAPLQSAVLIAFFIAVTAGMDAIVFMPLKDNIEAQELLALAMKLSPSLLVCIALAILAAAGRNVPGLIKMLCVFIIAAVGFNAGSFYGFLLLGGLFLLPGRGSQENVKADEMAMFAVAEDGTEDPIAAYLKRH